MFIQVSWIWSGGPCDICPIAIWSVDDDGPLFMRKKLKDETFLALESTVLWNVGKWSQQNRTRGRRVLIVWTFSAVYRSKPSICNRQTEKLILRHLRTFVPNRKPFSSSTDEGRMISIKPIFKSGSRLPGIEREVLHQAGRFGRTE
jgi:hypothetical protein